MIDASSRAEILYLLAELQERNALTFLVITHDLASARHFADRIAVMYAGRIVELASASELVEGPKHPYTRALLAAVPEADPANRSRRRPVVSGEPPVPSALPRRLRFSPSLSGGGRGPERGRHPAPDRAVAGPPRGLPSLPRRRWRWRRASGRPERGRGDPGRRDLTSQRSPAHDRAQAIDLRAPGSRPRRASGSASAPASG